MTFYAAPTSSPARQLNEADQHGDKQDESAHHAAPV
jgi:hypothetical protein